MPMDVTEDFESAESFAKEFGRMEPSSMVRRQSMGEDSEGIDLTGH